MSLSILICHLTKRKYTFDNLIDELESQIHAFGYYDDVEILLDNSEIDSVGEKRNRLLKRAKNEYVCFIDDDDRVSDMYLHELFTGIEMSVDCCSLKGIITENGLNPLIFEHSVKYNEYKTNPESEEIRYLRYPNHLNCIKSSIAKEFRFPEINHGEDTDWATQINKSGFIKTEHYIPEVIYYYDWKTK